MPRCQNRGILLFGVDFTAFWLSEESPTGYEKLLHKINLTTFSLQQTTNAQYSIIGSCPSRPDDGR